MVSWMLIIIALSVFQVLGFFFDFPDAYINISAILLLAAALGLLYHAHLIKERQQEEQKKRYKLIGQILRDAGFCTERDVLEALNKQSTGDIRLLGEILVTMNVISQEQLDVSLQEQARSRGMKK